MLSQLASENTSTEAHSARTQQVGCSASGTWQVPRKETVSKLKRLNMKILRYLSSTEYMFFK